jgi:hypothetical protein
MPVARGERSARGNGAEERYMSSNNELYHSFPMSTVFLRNLLNLIIFGLGAGLLSGFGSWAVITYLAFCAVMMLWVLRFFCRYCLYYGSTCVAGFGRIVPLLFQKGPAESFPSSAWCSVPMLLSFVVPTLGGLYLLIRSFSVTTLVVLILFLVACFVVSPILMNTRGCVHCRNQVRCVMYKPRRGQDASA